jgi:hypothetical protein
MASLTLKGNTFKNNDDYETNEDIWVMIKHYIPFGKIIYEPFYCSGRSGQILREMGFITIHEDEDFFIHHKRHHYDIIVSNPPFSIKNKILQTLYEIDKPFILIVPVSIITKQYFTELYKDKDVSILIPPKRLQFSKKGQDLNRCWFDCLFLTYKLGLDKQIIYI